MLQTKFVYTYAFSTCAYLIKILNIYYFSGLRKALWYEIVVYLVDMQQYLLCFIQKVSNSIFLNECKYAIDIIIVFI